MSQFVRPNIRAMAGYTPGEQPRDDGIIKLNTNENPYPPSPRVAAAVADVLCTDRLRKYPDPSGTAFRQAAGELFGLDPDCVLIGNGSDDILTILTRTFVPQGGLVASPTPSYLLYRTLADIQGARFATVPYTPEWALPEPWPIADAHLTFVANPNSPSGTVVGLEVLANLAERLAGPLVVDEAYADFAEANAIELLRRHRNVIVTRTLSKSYSLAGLRFGFGLAAPEVVRECTKVKDSYNCDMLSLAGAQAALQDQAYLEQTRAKILATRERMTQALRQLGFEVLPSQANFVWVRHAARPVQPLFAQLKERKILVRYMNYPGYGDGLRVSVGSDPDVDRFLEVLAALL